MKTTTKRNGSWAPTGGYFVAWRVLDVLYTDGLFATLTEARKARREHGPRAEIHQLRPNVGTVNPIIATRVE